MKQKVLKSLSTILTIAVLATSCRIKKEEIPSLDNLYQKEFDFSDDKLEKESIKNISNQIYAYLGNKIYIEDDYDYDYFKIVNITNDSKQQVKLMYTYDTDILSMNYQNNNIEINYTTVNDYVVEKSYKAQEDVDNYYYVTYINTEEESRSVYYTGDKKISISLYAIDGEYMLSINGNEGLRMIITQEDYTNLLLIMDRYSSGIDLEEFINEEVFQKYLDIIQIIKPDLYDEFGNLTNVRNLKLNI